MLYVDADVEVNYAVVLNYNATTGDWNDTKKAKLLFTDGTVKSVEVDFEGNDGTGDNKLGEFDIVSYTVDSDDVYSIKLVADSQTGKTGGSFVMENGANTFSIVDGNKEGQAALHRRHCEECRGRLRGQ